MPCSRPTTVTAICNRIFEKNPMSVLDIGIGFGKYGFLAREYTDVRLGRYFNWQTKIDGIEIYEKYIKQLQREIYDHIFIGDAVKILPTLDNYDMMICSDMLEHLSERDGEILLDTMKKKSKFAMIATPINVLHQDAIYDNENERHISSWSRQKLERWGKVSEYDNTYLLEIASINSVNIGNTVRIHYTGKFNDGNIFASTYNKEPEEITIGKGQILPYVENALIGMVEREFKNIYVNSANAYGPYRNEMTQVIERNQFPSHISPVPGQVLQDHQEDGSIIDVKISQVTESTVTLDANHPLAGKDLIYDIELIEII